jgi:hypothetical protein
VLARACQYIEGPRHATPTPPFGLRALEKCSPISREKFFKMGPSIGMPQWDGQRKHPRIYRLGKPNGARALRGKQTGNRAL